MSLQIAAQHLATKGRGPDTELVHMTKGEIAGLQSLAVKMGGTLTINPDTGLVEAGFLRSILPMLAGAAAMYFTGGLAGAGLMGMGATATSALAGAATGYALNPKGGLGSIAMGALGGYGGGSLAGGFMTAGTNALTTSALGDYAGTLASSGLAPGTAAYGEAASQLALAAQQQAAQAGIGQTLQAGAGQVFSSPSSAMQFAKQNMSGIGALAAPILGGMDQPTLAGMPPQSTGNIRPFSFTRNANTDDPNNPTVDQFYTAGTPMAAPGPDNFPYQPGQTIRMAEGGALDAGGGIASLGSYSDGGQLLKGPGDGVSDNIPAVIGKRQPARLADGEFVLPARIVSEIGNGSTDAGARELYKMMARIQKNRSKTVGKDKVAVDAKSRKLLPA